MADRQQSYLSMISQGARDAGKSVSDGFNVSVEKAREVADKIEAEVKKRAILTAVSDNGRAKNTVVREVAKVAPVTTFDTAVELIKRFPETSARMMDAPGAADAIRKVRETSQAVKDRFQSSLNTAADAVKSSVEKVRSEAKRIKDDITGEARLRAFTGDNTSDLATVREKAKAARDAATAASPPARLNAPEGFARGLEERGTRPHTPSPTVEAERLRGPTPQDLAERQVNMERGANPNDSTFHLWNRVINRSEAGKLHPKAEKALDPFVTRFGNANGIRAAIRLQSGKEEQKRHMEEKNAARVRGSTDEKRAANDRFRESVAQTRTAQADQLPTNQSGDIQVKAYTRRDGTKVRTFKRNRHA